MASSLRVAATNEPTKRGSPQPVPAAPVQKSGGRLVELDILRGFLLVWMTMTHLPTKASLVSNQTFGFVSGAEGFIFLAAFMVGQLEERIELKRGRLAPFKDIAKRTARIYLYHCGLLAIAFTAFAAIAIDLHRVALQNLLSFFFLSPRQAIEAAALLWYRPSLFDILPMYIVFMLLTPIAREIARCWSWEPVLVIGFGIWTAAQFGLRGWLYTHVNVFGPKVPQDSTGAFDLYAWQFLWIVGVALGTIFADHVNGKKVKDEQSAGIPRSVVTLSAVIASAFLVLRYSPADHWIDPNVYGWLIDKWHLGPARFINFSAIAVLLVRYGTKIASLKIFAPLAWLGQASLEVFSVHILCCLIGDSLNGAAEPLLTFWQQTLLLAGTITALFVTAYLVRARAKKKREAKAAAEVVAAPLQPKLAGA